MASTIKKTRFEQFKEAGARQPSTTSVSPMDAKSTLKNKEARLWEDEGNLHVDWMRCASEYFSDVPENLKVLMPSVFARIKDGAKTNIDMLVSVKAFDLYKFALSHLNDDSSDACNEKCLLLNQIWFIKFGFSSYLYIRWVMGSVNDLHSFLSSSEQAIERELTDRLIELGIANGEVASAVDNAASMCMNDVFDFMWMSYIRSEPPEKKSWERLGKMISGLQATFIFDEGELKMFDNKKNYPEMCDMMINRMIAA